MKVAIFIDGAYFEKILKHDYAGQRINFQKLSDILSGDKKETLRTYYYHCEPYQSSPPSTIERRMLSNKQKFFNYLSRLPRYEVKKGRLEYRGTDQNGKKIFRQKGVDTLLSIDMVSLGATRQISDVILLAGDSDYVPAVETVKPFGINIILYHGPRKDTYHQDLWKRCDERHPITQELIDMVKQE